ncbi:fatty oxidation complex protein [Staphylococcus epidermidis]|uniref:3-hydroxyacyl-CoA dehydrogenase family protein n=1 Tax=Staphylococcus epidermidis TaxID=1282 RepID=UPI000E016C89|nr:3-hydroxyacyl-CoA dehydrogenase NAD-binding domain-containing protein [Staphylococcus epidermidis]SUM53491.1 fatty oxidation complex protein [Staphylococcus epidermidis]
MKKVSVIGAGIMGSDVALDLSSQGYEVVLMDVNEEKLAQAAESIKKSYQLMQFVKKEKVDLSLDAVLKNIQFTTSLKHVINSNIIIENVTENWETKETLYTNLNNFNNEETLYLVNTSCISITRVAGLMNYPENVIGAHFMNPVPLKKMVEVIKGRRTSQETILKVKDFLKSLDKSAVIVDDFPGFVSNRILMLTINEAIWTVQDQVATPSKVDRIFKEGFGHRMGPLETGDLIGLDTILNSLKVLYEEFKDPKFRPCPLLVKMVDSGCYGRKTGKGFFEYFN